MPIFTVEIDGHQYDLEGDHEPSEAEARAAIGGQAPKQATAPPAAATRGMAQPSTMQPPAEQPLMDRLLHGPKVTDPRNGEPIQVLGDPGMLANISTVGGFGSIKGVPGILARAAGMSKAQGGENIAQAVTAAKDVPLQTPGIQAAVDEMMQYSGIENVPRVVRSLAKRLSTGDPFLVQKARLYAPAISRGSANEFAGLTPNMQRLLGGLKGPLNEAITAAAETVGKGEQYASGMKEYARASKAAKTMNETVKPLARRLANKGAEGAALTAGGGALYKLLFGRD